MTKLPNDARMALPSQRSQRARIRSRWAHWLAHNMVTAMMATGMTSRPTLKLTQ